MNSMNLSTIHINSWYSCTEFIHISTLISSIHSHSRHHFSWRVTDVTDLGRIELGKESLAVVEGRNVSRSELLLSCWADNLWCLSSDINLDNLSKTQYSKDSEYGGLGGLVHLPKIITPTTWRLVELNWAVYQSKIHMPKRRGTFYISLQKVSIYIYIDVSHFTDKGGANTNTCTSHFCTRPFFSPQDQVSTGDCPASEAGKNGVSSVLSLSNYKSPYRNRISWMIARLRHRRLYLLVPSKTLTPVRPFWINMAVMAIMAKRPLFSSVVSFNLRSAGSWQVGSGYLPLNPACLMGILWDPHFML